MECTHLKLLWVKLKKTDQAELVTHFHHNVREPSGWSSIVQWSMIILFCFIICHVVPLTLTVKSPRVDAT